MALRVLLADESATIKKVIQLALQEFAVEVKSVPVGTDVLNVCHEFKPDIIFVDILLTKKNGYEVCTELKKDPSTKSIPIVVMWSGFMELDQNKLKSANPDGKLEKPFEPDALRQLVKDLVPATNENLIANYLSFPALPEIQENDQDEKTVATIVVPPPQSAAPPIPQAPKPPPVREENFSFDSLEIPTLDETDEPEEFQQIALKPQGIEKAPAIETKPQQEQWQRQDISQLKIELPESVFAKNDLSKDKVPPIDTSESKIALSSGSEEISLDEIEAFSPATKRSSNSSPNLKAGTLSESQAETLIRAQVREVLENIAWKILPDMAERIIREELHKLLKDAER